MGELLDRGFEPPITFVAISVDGNVFGCRHTGSGEPQIVADHGTGEHWRAPVNLLYVDSRGEAARVLLRALDQPPEFLN